MNKKNTFTNLLSKYLPKHFKTSPLSIEVFLDQDLNDVRNTQYAYLKESLTISSCEIEYELINNQDHFLDEGVIKIEDEYIYYNAKDSENNKLLNIERGFLNSKVANHCLNKILFQAKLKKDINSLDTIIEFTSVINYDNIPERGKIAIFSDENDYEIIAYNNYNKHFNNYIFTNVERGIDGTIAQAHAAGSTIQNISLILIEIVPTIKYNKGLFENKLKEKLKVDDKIIFLDKKFTAELAEDINKNTNIIKLKNISNNNNTLYGDIPQNGYIKINNEIIKYGYYQPDFKTNEYNEITFLKTGTLLNCIRGVENSTPQEHLANTNVYYAIPNSGEIIINNEYIFYDYYVHDENDKNYIILGSETNPVKRGIYGSIISEHPKNSFITQHKNIDFELTGIIKINNEYFKYLFVDDKFFYINNQTLNLYNIKNNVIEYHSRGSIIKTIYFNNENTNLINFLYTIGSYIDYAINKKIESLSNLSDLDNIEFEYLKYFVNELNENLDDYQNLPFFSESQDKIVVSKENNIFESNVPHNLQNNETIKFFKNAGGVDNKKYYLVEYINNYQFKIKDIITNKTVNLIKNETNLIKSNTYRIRLFTKELVTIYKQKGLISALKLWHKVISEELKSYQDLWTFNYYSFHSLPSLIILLYNTTRTYYPHEENFYKPQISNYLFNELINYYNNKKIFSKYVKGDTGNVYVNINNLKIKIYKWEYLNILDNEIYSNNGLSFDDKIIPSYSENNENIFYDKEYITLQLRDNPEKEVYFPILIEDSDIDLFKFEEELEKEKKFENDKSYCTFETLDIGLVSDHETNWLDNKKIPLDITYCNLNDKNDFIKLDLKLKYDLRLDNKDCICVLDSNINENDDKIIVKILKGKLYDPQKHFNHEKKPNILPKGFLKIDNEIISYKKIKNYDIHTNSFLEKRYILEECIRGEYNTKKESHKVNLFQDIEDFLHNKKIYYIYDNLYYIKVFKDPLNYANIKTGDKLILVQEDGYKGIFQINRIVNYNNACTNKNEYHIEFFVLNNNLNLNKKTVSFKETYNCIINKNNSSIYSKNHNLETGDSIYFLKSVGNINAYDDYKIIKIDEDNFYIQEYNDNNYLILHSIDDNINYYKRQGTRIIKTYNYYNGLYCYQYKYGIIQHLLWRLQNEINGNDLETTYNLSKEELKNKKLDEYKGLKNGIIFPTPHFKYNFQTKSLNPNFTLDDIRKLIIKKVKEYKQKHTTPDLTIDYEIFNNIENLIITNSFDIFEYENLQSDCYFIKECTFLDNQTIYYKNHDFHNNEIIYIYNAEEFNLNNETPFYIIYINKNSFKISSSSYPQQTPITFTNTNIKIYLTQHKIDNYNIKFKEINTNPPNYNFNIKNIKLDEINDELYGEYVYFTYNYQNKNIIYKPFISYPFGLKLDTFRNRKRFLLYK